MADKAYSSSQNALWLKRSCVGALEFLGCHDVSDLTRPRGEVSASYQRVGKDKFKVISTRQSIPDLGTVSFSWFRDIVNLIDDLPCPPTIMVFYSTCGADEDPTNYDFIDVLEDVRVTETTQAGVVNAIGPDDATDVGVDIVVEASAEFSNYYVLKPLTSTDIVVSALAGRIIDDIAVCDPDAECSNDCGSTTIGCQTLWIITNGSPGVYGTAAIYKSTDGGDTWTEQTNSMTNDDDNLSSVSCDSDVVIITNGTTAEYQYTNDGGTTWSLITTPTQVINDVFVLSSTKIWMAAEGGYIYFSSDKGASVSTQTAGSLTTQGLNSIHFATDQIGYAVGDSNTFLRSTNGGTNWSVVTGPSVGVQLNVVRGVPDTDIVYIGDASGNLFQSTDNGDTWSTALSSVTNLAGGINDISICECNRIVIAGQNATDGAGAVYDSIDGGNTFVAQTIPTGDTGAEGVNAITCCDVNTYFAVGDGGLIFELSGESFRDSA